MWTRPVHITFRLLLAKSTVTLATIVAQNGSCKIIAPTKANPPSDLDQPRSARNFMESLPDEYLPPRARLWRIERRRECPAHRGRDSNRECAGDAWLAE